MVVSSSTLQSYDAPLDRIRLHREGDSRVIVLTEGAPDRTVLRKLLPSHVQIFPLGTRPVVLDVLRTVLAEGLGPAVAVVDRDFDEAVQIQINGGMPVVPYDNADLESALWATPILEESLAVIGNLNKISAFGGAEKIRSFIDSLLLPLQRLRAANTAQSLGLRFDTIDLRRRIKPGKLTLNIEGLCDSLHSRGGNVSRADLIRIARSYDCPCEPIYGLPLFRGKDRLSALGIVMKRRLGDLSHKEAEAENISRIFYAASRPELLEDCNWVVGLLALVASQDC